MKKCSLACAKTIAMTLMASTLVATSALANEQNNGAKIYQQSCETCHSGGFKGWMTGAPEVGDKEAWKPLIAKGVETITMTSIKGINKMPAKGGCQACSNDDIKAAVEHMIKLSQ